MTDVQEQSVADPEGTNETATTTDSGEKPEKVTKAPKVPHACLCSFYEVRGATDDEIFSTGCEQTTQSTFAQGHDARLVSFLVDGYFDGYKLWFVKDGEVEYATPAGAAAVASEALRDKAVKATANRQQREDGKAQRLAEKEAAKAARAAEKAAKAAAKEEAKAKAEAEKASAPKPVGVEVVAGSAEGDSAPAPEGQVKIKVGRWEYNATIDDEGNATYVDGKGDEQVVERDGYRLLEPVA